MICSAGRNTTREQPYYPWLAIAVIMLLLVLPPVANPWFLDGETLSLPSGAVIRLQQQGAVLILEVIQGTPAMNELKAIAEERFGPAAVLKSTETTGIYHIHTGVFND